MNDRDAVLAKLRHRYKSGQLEYLIGAGASMASGLPSWNVLNQRLLKSYLGSFYRDLELGARDLDVAARVFIDAFGRDAAVDAVRERTDFAGWLSRALYGHGPVAPETIHFELAAAAKDMGSPRGIPYLHTFNYDDLLEQAMRTLSGVKVERVVGAIGTRSKPHVVHLHGYVGPDGTLEGDVVLSERDYHRTDSRWPERALADLLHEKRNVLFVGLSLADPRLRRVLLDRLSIEPRKRGRLFAILPESACDDDAELIERLSHNFVRQHARDYWADWQLEVIFTKAHGEIPLLLRRIRWGDDVTAWAKRGYEFLADAAHRPAPGLHPERIHEPKLQEALVAQLARARDRLKYQFAVPRDEAINMGCFLPERTGTHIRLAFHLREDREGSKSVVDPDLARRRRLNVASLAAAQGVAGRVFQTGEAMSATGTSPVINAGFTEEMKKDWDGDRIFNSVFCVPVYGSPDWAPLGVMYLSSNRTEPFWERSDATMSDLKRLLLALFQKILNY